MEVTKAVELVCKRLPKDGLDFVFEKWVDRWRKCIAVEGSYFENAYVNLDDSESSLLYIHCFLLLFEQPT